MKSDVLSSVIGGAGSLLGTVTSAIYNAQQAKAQREWSERMQAEQNAWNMEMWAKTNQYNSPIEQVRRLREAGLNPLFHNLDGSAANGLESAQPLGYQAARMGSVENPVTAGLQAASQIAAIANTQAQTAKTNNENLTETQKRENMQAEYLVTKQTLNNFLANEDLTREQAAQIRKNIEWADRLNQATISEKESIVRLNDFQKKRIDALLPNEVLLQIKNIEDFEHRWSLIDEQIRKMSAETDILYEDLANYALNHMQSGLLGIGISLPNMLRQAGETLKLFSKYRGKDSTVNSGVR